MTCNRSVDFSEYSNFRHKSSNCNIVESGVKHLTSNGQMMDQKFVYVVYNIKYFWVIMWHIFTSTNNTTTILFPIQFWELLYTYQVIKQSTEQGQRQAWRIPSPKNPLKSVHKDVTEGRTHGRTHGSVTISLCNFVGEGVKGNNFTSIFFINN